MSDNDHGASKQTNKSHVMSAKQTTVPRNSSSLVSMVEIPNPGGERMKQNLKMLCQQMPYLEKEKSHPRVDICLTFLGEIT